jgi:hypothetical protein
MRRPPRARRAPILIRPRVRARRFLADHRVGQAHRTQPGDHTPSSARGGIIRGSVAAAAAPAWRYP